MFNAEKEIVWNEWLMVNKERKLSSVWDGVKLNTAKNTKAITIMGNRS